MNDDTDPYIVVAFSASHEIAGKGIRLDDPEILLPIELELI